MKPTGTVFLNQIEPGSSARIFKFTENTPNTMRLQEVGLIEGTLISVIRQISKSASIQVKLHNSVITLALEDAKRILVA